MVKDGGMHWIPLKQKLIADLHLKQNIVVRHILLRPTHMLADSFKVQRVPQFDQKPCRKTCIDTLASKRSEAKMKVEKEIFKLY